MELSDLTMANDKVGDFFRKDTYKYTPIMELLYIHEHPFMAPNFMTEIRDTIKRVAVIVSTNDVDPKIVERYRDLLIKMAPEVAQLDVTNASIVLLALKDMYRLSEAILKNY